MAFFSMGLNTYKVPMTLHATNRDKIHARFQGLGVQSDKSAILLQGGSEINKYDTDTTYLFVQESFFQYLFGVKEPDFYGAIDLANKRSLLFVPRLPEEYATWMGKIEPPSFFRDRYEVDEVYFSDEIDEVLQSKGISSLHVLHGTNSDSGLSAKPAVFKGIEKYHIVKDFLHAELCECRVIKTPEEIALMKYINKISSDAHREVMKKCKAGMKEYQLESTFLNYAYTHGGCRQVSYTCICATGCNASILHYGHAGAPNDADIITSDMLMMDMGAQYHGYCSDISCSFPASGKFSPEQRAVYESVLNAQNAVIAALKPGVAWTDMHLLAEREMLAGLIKMGVLKDAPIDDMITARIGAIFMPHGLGHFLGVDTHDVGGYPAGTERSTLPGLKSLRTVRILQEGMVLTVEPGLYFIPYLIESALQNPEKALFINEEVIKKFYKFGGVRIEDDLVITATGSENMSTTPKTIEEIEAVMASGSQTN